MGDGLGGSRGAVSILTPMKMAVVVCPKSKHCVMLFTPLHFPLSFSLSEGTKHQLSMQRKLKDPPKVTGLSPKEGIPGTKVTIRGENLGTSSKDLIGEIFTFAKSQVTDRQLKPQSSDICPDPAS